MLPDKRLSILEHLRIPAHTVSNSMSKHYLNQTIVLAEKPRKIAELAHSLHSQLAMGYTIVAMHTKALGSKTSLDQASSIISTAVHRAITDYTLNMRRHYQLYEPVSSKLWHRVHQLYLLADQDAAIDTPIKDLEFGDCSVKSCYIRTLLMSCSKPNQLRQEDFIELFKPLSQWSEQCQLNSINDQDLFFIDPTKDHAPIYRELVESIPSEPCFSLNTQALANKLVDVRHATDPSQLKCQVDGVQVSLDLISHLIVNWGSMCKRTYMRLEASDALELSMGLCSTHHYISGELTLGALVAVRGKQVFDIEPENPFLKTPPSLHQSKDNWDLTYENNMRAASVAIESIDYEIGNYEQQKQKATNTYSHHGAHMINSSAHGYCVEWLEESEIQIKTGEIVGIRSTGSKYWGIAAIRWVSRMAERTQLGLQLISSNAAPYGARIVHKTGDDNNYLRVLVLPENPAAKQPKTLLTPRMPFREGMKLILNQRGKEIQIQLIKKVNDTGSYSQFEFKILAGTHIAPKEEGSIEAREETSFNSLCDDL